jgi:hypothetical protein
MIVRITQHAARSTQHAARSTQHTQQIQIQIQIQIQFHWHIHAGPAREYFHIPTAGKSKATSAPSSNRQ